jgi:hypothetical protein
MAHNLRLRRQFLLPQHPELVVLEVLPHFSSFPILPFAFLVQFEQLLDSDRTYSQKCFVVLRPFLMHIHDIQSGKEMKRK